VVKEDATHESIDSSSTFVTFDVQEAPRNINLRKVSTEGTLQPSCTGFSPEW
jgi:hypothetical protein